MLRPGASEGIRFSGGFVSAADAPSSPPVTPATAHHPGPHSVSSPPPVLTGPGQLQGSVRMSSQRRLVVVWRTWMPGLRAGLAVSSLFRRHAAGRAGVAASAELCAAGVRLQHRVECGQPARPGLGRHAPARFRPGSGPPLSGCMAGYRGQGGTALLHERLAQGDGERAHSAVPARSASSFARTPSQPEPTFSATWGSAAARSSNRSCTRVRTVPPPGASRRVTVSRES